jgi:hypothetical protein
MCSKVCQYQRFRHVRGLRCGLIDTMKPPQPPSKLHASIVSLTFPLEYETLSAHWAELLCVRKPGSDLPWSTPYPHLFRQMRSCSDQFYMRRPAN